MISAEQSNMSSERRAMKLVLIGIGIGLLLTIPILAITIATFVKINKTLDGPSTGEKTPASDLVGSMKIEDVMNHLKEFQRIADVNNGTRAVSTLGFNQTLDYIVNTLTTHTDFKININYFPIRQFALSDTPVLVSSINDIEKTYLYSDDLNAADFYHMQFSTGIDMQNFEQITVIPNLGCSVDDWQNANPPPAGKVALVKRGVCGFEDKGNLAAQFNVLALLLYNDGARPDRVTPMAIGFSQQTYIPGLFLSYPIGNELANAAKNLSNNVGIRLVIHVKDLPLSPIGNICADTSTGDATQTILIGSHSDSVPAGPGINDNGSGSAANLGLAVALARLFQTSTYPTYKYRVRFCWWGAEEIGLLGSEFHVKTAKISTIVGERLSDYLLNLNYDMLGSPNFMFGIHDGRSANENTPQTGIPGSIKITALYRSWFDQEKLPWTYAAFDGRSDYWPFLFEGIAAGGVMSGYDGRKSQEERDYYDRILGQGKGGIAGAIHDPCYHQACDSIQNINQFGYEKLVKAAAYALESLGRNDNLTEWLYPQGRMKNSNDRSSLRKYYSNNE